MHVLFVCTANQCRSPIAQALFEAQRLDKITATSAGLLPGGRPMPRDGVVRLAERGIDLSGHVSVELTDNAVAGADLIIGMSRRHVRTVVADHTNTRRRCFTLKDFVRRAEHLGPTSGLEALLAALDTGRPTRALLGRDDADDVTDPMGRPGRVWDSVIAELSDQTARLSRILAALPIRAPA